VHNRRVRDGRVVPTPLCTTDRTHRTGRPINSAVNTGVRNSGAHVHSIVPRL
jgi:hypothetical protein